MTDNAQQGGTVKVHYSVSLEDGTLVESSSGRDPLEFTVGEGHVLAGIEEAVVGMSPGDQKTVELAPERAYGARREELVIDMSRTRLPEDVDPRVGLQLEMRNQDGHTFPVVVTDVTEEQVRLDANHPLAGQALRFELELVSVV